MKQKVLIVEDQFIEANNLQMILERAGYSVCTLADSVVHALKVIESEKPDLVLLDIYLKGKLTGIDLAWTLKEKNTAFIYLSANSNKETLEAAKATRPYGFLVKPFREKDVLITLEIARYLHENSLESIIRKEPGRYAQNKKSPDTKRSVDYSIDDQNNFLGIIGKNKELKTVLEHLQIVAPTDTSVLILGESGTGKERIAECIHELSPRRINPLVKVNCAALPATLIESVLFGHERGSFTGATERRLGKFEQANKGTIFLDEIGEMSLEVQVKLLRVLQEKEIERLGGNEVINIDVRVIAATNRNLEKEVAEGRFRMDLYFRLSVFPLTIPPLRERKEDIPLLTQHFIEYYSKKIGRSIKGISPDLLNNLISHQWPGNVRELGHTIERAVLLSKDDEIKHINLTQINQIENRIESRVKTIEENERDHIIDVLKKCNGKVFGKGGAAELLDMNASTLNSRIKKLGIEKEINHKVD